MMYAQNKNIVIMKTIALKRLDLFVVKLVKNAKSENTVHSDRKKTFILSQGKFTRTLSRNVLKCV